MLRPWVDRKLFRPIRRASVNQDELISDIRDTLSDHGDVLITTNLDNDDG